MPGGPRLRPSSLLPLLVVVLAGAQSRCVLVDNGEHYRAGPDGSLDDASLPDPPPCAAGATRRCYGGPASTAGVGACHAGTQTCAAAAGGQTAWGPCDGEVDPQAERCDGADDDCDGAVDNGCNCTLGSTRACYSGAASTRRIGVCRDGMQACAAHSDGTGSDWGACEGEALPGMESCNGLDDDCNGQIDEGCACTMGDSRACYSGPPGTQGHGGCHGGAQQCGSGGWGLCMGQALPQPELCDGVDNDCDGVVDNGCLCEANATRACYDGPAATRGVGACRDGTQACVGAADSVGSSWGPCAGQTLPAAERCDGVDDNCDGTVDEGFRAADVEVTYTGGLTPRFPTCLALDASTTLSACSVAAHRYCAAAGSRCTDSGFGPVESAGDNAVVTCVKTRVSSMAVTYQALSTFNSACNGLTETAGANCANAIHLLCASMGGGVVSGYGPVEMGVSAMNPLQTTASIDCLGDDVAERVDTTYAVLATYQANCNGTRNAWGLPCYEAAHRFCMARGAVSGYGPVAHDAGGAATVICVRP